jgi:MFS family permease
MISGGALVGRFGKYFPKRVIVSRAIFIAGSLLFILGVSPLITPIVEHFPRNLPRPFFYQPPLSSVIAFGSFLLGLAMVSVVVPSQTVLQENTNETLRGKIYAVLGVMSAAFTILPIIIVGGLADLVGTRPIFLLMGGTVALIGLLAIFPQFYFEKKNLPKNIREFLGLGHWKK